MHKGTVKTPLRFRTLPSGCVVCTSHKPSGRGYVYTTHGATKPGAIVGLHRFMWEKVNGCIPEGLNILHTCSNPRCVNVEHLYAGTDADNSRDKIKYGELKTLIKPNDVPIIRHYLNKGISCTLLGKLYNVARTTISDIKHHRTWKDY